MNFSRTAKKLTAGTLALSFLWTAAGASAFTNSFTRTHPIAEGTSYTRLEGRNNAGTQKTNYITYKPNGTVRPVIVYAGDHLYGSKSTISDAARYLESQGEHVIAGLNGDFFVVASSIPIGLVIRDGELISSDAWQYAVGFTENGAVITGQPTMNMKLTGTSGTATVSYYNKTRTAAGIYLLDSRYDKTTHLTQPGKNIVLERLDNKPITVGGKVRLRVVSNGTGSSAMPIADNQMVLTMQDKSTAAWVDFQPGEEVQLTITPSTPGWQDVKYAVGGKNLVRGGVVNVTGIDAATKQTARSAVGVKADGTVIFYQNDGGSSSHSIGLTAKQLAEEMRALGCVEVICLDGGGSSAMTLRKPGASGVSLVSRPSDGKERKCANYIFLVSDAKSDGEAEYLHIEPVTYYVLPGAKTEFSIRAADKAYEPADMPSGRVDYDVTAGSVSDQIYTAPMTPGVVTLSAEIDGAEGETQICVTEDVNSITLKNGSKTVSSSIALDPGDQIDLDAKLYHLGMPMAAADNLLTWRVTGDIGKIDENGRFTASDTSGKGKITVGYKKTTKTINVTVGMDFTDVKPKDWYYDAVKYVFDNGIMVGSTTTQFEPEGQLTRSMFAAVLYRMEGSPEVTEKPAFKDVKAGTWDANAIVWASQNGIVSGYSDGTFGGEKPLTREQLASMLYRYAAFKGIDTAARADLSVFADAKTVSSWAKDAMAWAVQTGLVSGTSKTALSPAGTATRSQCASILMRFADLKPVEIAEPELPEEPVLPEGPDFIPDEILGEIDEPDGGYDLDTSFTDPES